MWVLGINGPPGWHHAAAALVDGDGRVWAMAEEERFGPRIKYAVNQYPELAARYCLEQAGIAPEDVDVVAVGWDVPRVRAEAGRGWSYDEPDRLLRKTLLRRFAARRRPDVVYVPHHHAHAAAAFHASGFAAAAVLVVDGNGEDESISIYEARAGAPLVRRARWPRPFSLGYLYEAATRAVGLHFLETGKTMGLASYGRAAGVEPWPLLRAGADGFEPPFSLPASAGWEEVAAAWRAVFGGLADLPRQTASAALDQDPAAVRLAWSAQAALEQAMGWLAGVARREAGCEELCLAGGVALNCSANGCLPEPLYAPPVPHDAGVSLGAAWTVAPPRGPRRPLDPFLGPDLSGEDAERAVREAGLRARPAHPLDVAQRLHDGQIGALAAGRAEVGPRALGRRSIIASPANVGMRDRVNDAKRRERWRPLAPVSLPSAAAELWEPRAHLQRYMLGATAASRLARAVMPAAVHVDGTVRAQIVERGAGPIADVLEALEANGAPPVLLNTSLNARGEPVVNTAAEAVAAFEAMQLDFLVVGDVLCTRS